MFQTDLLSIIRSLNTVYTAIGICRSSYADCLLADSPHCVRLFVKIFRSSNANSPGLAVEVLTVTQYCAWFVCALLHSAVGIEDFVAWMDR